MTSPVWAQEKQLTFSPKNHMLDNNDNFSSDGRFLCYDTRDTVAAGIEGSRTIEKVELSTGKETILYAPEPPCGVGAVSYSPTADRVAFIHGPRADQGPYAKSNRRGAEVLADGSQGLTWLDARDVLTQTTPPGAHRGGTHRHEYSLDGRRVGCTYDDALLTQYDRTVALLEPSPKAPSGATHYFVNLAPIVPKGTAKPGEIEKAAGDSWVGREGRVRAFIGKVRLDDGVSYEECLFVAEIPADLDVTTADSGDTQRFPSPPKGVVIRRLTHTRAEGIVRGTPDGTRIAYFAKAPDGTRQVFVVPVDGSDKAEDPAKRPVQVTRLEKGAASDLRWDPTGTKIACISDNAVTVTGATPGPNFGRSVYLTPRGDQPARSQLVWSPDGTLFAFCKPIATEDESGLPLTTFDGKDFMQVFTLPCPADPFVAAL